MLLLYNRYDVTNKDGKTQMFIIHSLLLSDAGVYKCSIGDRETSCVLDVDPC